MKLTFTVTHEDVRNARALQEELEHLLENDVNDSSRNVIKALLQDVNRFLSDPDLEKKLSDTGEHDQENTDGLSPFEALFSFWHFLLGPSSREMALGKQRAELIERAEHAENSAFEALAELADMKREHEETLQKLKKLEEQLADLKNRQVS